MRLALAILLLASPGAAQDGSEATASLTLRWHTPASQTDGSFLDDLKSYEIEFGAASPANLIHFSGARRDVRIYGFRARSGPDESKYSYVLYAGSKFGTGHRMHHNSFEFTSPKTRGIGGRASDLGGFMFYRNRFTARARTRAGTGLLMLFNSKGRFWVFENEIVLDAISGYQGFISGPRRACVFSNRVTQLATVERQGRRFSVIGAVPDRQSAEATEERCGRPEITRGH